MFNQYTFKSIGSINRHMKNMSDNVSDINNIFTVGYKSKQTSFHDTLTGMQQISFRDHNDGVSKATGRELDFSIQGKGFFEVQLPDGTLGYTRDGSFTLGPNGELLSSQGYPVVTSQPEREFVAENYDELADGTIKSFDVGVGSSATFIPVGSSVRLDDDGTLRTDDDSIIGKINLITFTNTDGLQDMGDNLYMATEDAGEAKEVTIGEMLGESKIKQGALESSNVSVVTNMSQLVQLNTAIKAEMKIIKVLDQMQESLNSTITRNI